MTKKMDPEPEPERDLAASPQGADQTPEPDPEPEILDPADAELAPKGNAREPGSRVERPGMAHINANGTRLLGQVAKARNLKTFTPQAVQVARGSADTYYLIPVATDAPKVVPVKYAADNSNCRVNLFPYLQQAGLIVPSDHHWFVPAYFDRTSKYAPSLLLDFGGRENLPISQRGPQQKPQA